MDEIATAFFPYATASTKARYKEKCLATNPQLFIPIPTALKQEKLDKKQWDNEDLIFV
jgi:hypothetical protein